MSQLLTKRNKPDKFFYLSLFILCAVLGALFLFFLNSYNESSKIITSPQPQVLGETVKAASGLDLLFGLENNSALAGQKNQKDYFTLLFSKDFLQLLQTKTIDLNYANQYEALYKNKSEKAAGAVAVDVGSGSLVTLGWDKFKEPPDKIQIYRSASPVDLGELLAELSGQQTGYYDIAVKKNEIYYYTIITLDQKGQTNEPVKITAGPIKDLEPPLSPTNIKILPLADTVGFKITWQNPKAPDLAYVNIYRSTKKGILSTEKNDNSQPSSLVRLEAGANQEAVYEDKNIEPNTAYYYTLTATDIDGNESLKNLFGPQPAPGNPNLFSPIH